MTSPSLVLVVEDEFLIQEIIQAVLEEGGFSVDQACDAEEALKRLDENGSEYCALVTDIRLGPSRLSGWDVAWSARKINAELPVVYMTGDSAHAWATNGVPNSVVVQKPFAAAQIATAVIQLIEALPPAAGAARTR